MARVASSYFLAMMSTTCLSVIPDVIVSRKHDTRSSFSTSHQLSQKSSALLIILGM